MRVIVGLGNPGRRYRGTRHNLGRDVVERLAADLGVRLREDGWVQSARARVGAGTIVLAIPETYMNASGQAVRDVLRRRRRRPGDLLVIHDDLDLPLGQVRLKPGNGPGGHNGVRSIIEALGTDQFPRLRIGIGRPPAGVDPTEYVLERFTPDERSVIDAAIARAASAARAVVSDGLPAAMNRYNVRTAPGKAVIAP